MISYIYRPKNTCACTNIYMYTQSRGTATTTDGTQRYLLENQAVGAYLCLWVDDDAVRVWDQKPPIDFCGQINLCLAHD
jgi:hypothetical protein